MRAHVRRWTRYGHDRLYVETDGVQVGFRDLKSGEDHPEGAEHAEVLKAACDQWQALARTGGDLQEPVDLPSPAADTPDMDNASRTAEGVVWTDLATNMPGQAARAQAGEAWAKRREEKPVRAVLGRLLDLRTDERAWRVGADGEERVASSLEKVGRKDPRWKFLHAVPVGRNGSDIDHVAVGPGGVFTINAKHHPAASVWVGGDTFMVNGQRQPYIRNSRHEAMRATRLLGEAAGFEVPVRGLVVTVRAKSVTIKRPPVDVDVVERYSLARWLMRRPTVLSQGEVAAIYEVARRSTTWVG